MPRRWIHPFTEPVITSYSIHYTKLYDDIQIVQVDEYGVETSSTKADSRVLSADEGYHPETGQRYVYVTGTEKVLKIEKEYITSSFWGIDWLSADPGRQPDVTRVISQSDPVPLETGTFVEWNLDKLAEHTYSLV